MKTDRELLELAAKAAGVPVEGWARRTEMGMRLVDEYHNFLRYWNPLTDDGDVLRLATTIAKNGHQLNIFMYDDEIAVYGPNESFLYKHRGDAGRAVRFAIVRAVAAIGEAMP